MQSRAVRVICSVRMGAAGPASAALYLKPPYSSGLWLGFIVRLGYNLITFDYDSPYRDLFFRFCLLRFFKS